MRIVLRTLLAALILLFAAAPLVANAQAVPHLIVPLAEPPPTATPQPSPGPPTPPPSPGPTSAPGPGPSPIPSSTPAPISVDPMDKVSCYTMAQPGGVPGGGGLLYNVATLFQNVYNVVTLQSFSASVANNAAHIAFSVAFLLWSLTFYSVVKELREAVRARQPRLLLEAPAFKILSLLTTVFIISALSGVGANWNWGSATPGTASSGGTLAQALPDAGQSLVNNVFTISTLQSKIDGTVNTANYKADVEKVPSGAGGLAADSACSWAKWFTLNQSFAQEIANTMNLGWFEPVAVFLELLLVCATTFLAQLAVFIALMILFVKKVLLGLNAGIVSSIGIVSLGFLSHDKTRSYGHAYYKKLVNLYVGGVALGIAIFFCINCFGIEQIEIMNNLAPSAKNFPGSGPALLLGVYIMLSYIFAALALAIAFSTERMTGDLLQGSLGISGKELLGGIASSAAMLAGGYGLVKAGIGALLKKNAIQAATKATASKASGGSEPATGNENTDTPPPSNDGPPGNDQSSIQTPAAVPPAPSRSSNAQRPARSTAYGSDPTAASQNGQASSGDTPPAQAPDSNTAAEQHAGSTNSEAADAIARARDRAPGGSQNDPLQQQLDRADRANQAGDTVAAADALRKAREHATDAAAAAQSDPERTMYDATTAAIDTALRTMPISDSQLSSPHHSNTSPDNAHTEPRLPADSTPSSGPVSHTSELPNTVAPAPHEQELAAPSTVTPDPVAPRSQHDTAAPRPAPSDAPADSQRPGQEATTPSYANATKDAISQDSSPAAETTINNAPQAPQATSPTPPRNEYAGMSPGEAFRARVRKGMDAYRDTPFARNVRVGQTAVGKAWGVSKRILGTTADKGLNNALSRHAAAILHEGIQGGATHFGHHFGQNALAAQPKVNVPWAQAPIGPPAQEVAMRESTRSKRAITDVFSPRNQDANASAPPQSDPIEHFASAPVAQSIGTMIDRAHTAQQNGNLREAAICYSAAATIAQHGATHPAVTPAQAPVLRESAARLRFASNQVGGFRGTGPSSARLAGTSQSPIAPPKIRAPLIAPDRRERLATALTRISALAPTGTSPQAARAGAALDAALRGLSSHKIRNIDMRNLLTEARTSMVEAARLDAPNAAVWAALIDAITPLTAASTLPSQQPSSTPRETIGV